MIKGILSVFIVSIFIALVSFFVFYFAGIIIWFSGILFVGIMIGTLILFFIVFIFALIVFFALFYYLAEKKPEIKPGEYLLKDEKGKVK